MVYVLPVDLKCGFPSATGLCSAEAAQPSSRGGEMLSNRPQQSGLGDICSQCQEVVLALAVTGREGLDPYVVPVLLGSSPVAGDSDADSACHLGSAL